MKNIHILSTDKPSKLLKDLVDKTYQFKKEVTFGNRIELPLNIYITSNEEIKNGDYVIINGLLMFTQNKTEVEINAINQKNNNINKIILTTDQELIKDGVQGIDDEFLEWFCNNSSCEFVEVNKMSYGYLSGFAHAGYKIIIQKEEPKQETIEETYNRVFDGKLDRVLKAGFVAGFSASTVTKRINEEQDKNKYSEKEVIDLWNWLNDGFIIRKSLPSKEELVGWFEQLKKK